ncbi:hypothetical protein CL622_06730 [archaeon]|nr:hypothetical protein [archaeon]|tara:strand:+ start:150 stop:752 length:603 start_codon:yes stop_codon:yes gene_type:complete
MKPIKKRGQFWYMDFIMAIIIISIISLIFVKTVIGMTQTKNLTEGLLIEAQEISQNLIAVGEPTDWNTHSEWWDDPSVKQLGLTDGNKRFNLDKLRKLGDGTLTDQNYAKAQLRLGTNKHFYVYLNDRSIIYPAPGHTGAGKLHVDNDDGGWTTVTEVRDEIETRVQNKEIKQIIEFNRLVFVDDTYDRILRMTVLVWTE